MTHLGMVGGAVGAALLEEDTAVVAGHIVMEQPWLAADQLALEGPG